MERDILHVDMDAFFVSVERIADPSLRGRPLVVGGFPPGRGVVMCASYEARSCGVRSGMPARRALRLCPGATLIHPNFPLYERASRAVFDILKNYSPVIEPASMEEAYLDLTGTGRLLGPPRDVALKVSREISGRLGLTATAGVASNRLVAKVAAEVAKPSGVMDVAHGYEADILAPLRVHYLPSVGPATEERLRWMGVKLVGDLAAIPPEYLEAAFGKAGLVLHVRSRGIDDTPVAPRRRKPSISSEETLPAESCDPEELRAILFLRVEALSSELRARGERASSVTVTACYSDFVEVSRSSSLLVESDLEMEIFPAAALLLDRILGRRVLLRRLGLRISRMKSGCWQVPLFDSGAAARRRNLLCAVDRMRKKYGGSVLQWGIAAGLPARPGGCPGSLAP